MTENGAKRVNINLLPQDVIDKRRGEQRLVYALFVGLVIAGLIFVIYGFNLVRISGRESVVRQLEAENAKYKVAIEEVQIFQDKQSQLEKRKKLIESISGFDFSWSKFLNDVSLIIPNDVWLVKISGDDKIISFDGMAQSDSSSTSDIGHKLVAKWLVHLGQVNSLTDVWLTESDRLKDKEAGKIKFTTTAKIKQPEITQAASAIPAPPTSGSNAGASK